MYLCTTLQLLFMRKTFSIYIVAYLLLLLFVIGLQFVYPKLELHLLLNSYHTEVLDVFFKYYTTFAEWTLYVLALLPLIWKRKELTIFFAISELSAAAVIQLLKHLITTMRPICMFEKCHDVVLPLVEGVDLHRSNSFPSGHASTFFIFFTCCALILAYQHQLKAPQNDRRRWIMINLAMLALFMLAALGAYSRIYLSQHFLVDVCVGSFIGFITPCLVFYFGRKKILKLKD